LLIDVIGKEVKEVEVGDIPVNAVADVDVVIAVVIEVEHECAPTPVGGGNAAIIADLEKFAVAIVELEAVFDILIIEAGAEFGVEQVGVIEGAGGFEAVVITGQHVCGEEVGVTVIIDIGHVGAHGGHAGMAYTIFEFVFEGAVLLIDIEVVAFIGVVGYVDIGPAIAVDIGDQGAEAEADEGAVDACLAGDFGKVAVVISVEMVAAAPEKGLYRPCGIGEVAPVGIVEGIDRDGAVIDHEAVEVAVAVIVEEGDLGSIGGDVEAIFGGGLGEGAVVVIDIEFVASVAVAHMAGVTDIDVEPAVVVDVYHGDPGAPHTILAEAGFVGDIFELEVALVEVQLIAAHIGGEEDIGEPVVVDIADGYAAAVVKIAEEEAIVQFAVLYIIHKVDTGIIH
jgi:hypothetical protein